MMAKRGFMRSMPIWVRVPGIITLVLLVVVMTTTLLNASGVGSRDATHMAEMGGGGHGSGDIPRMTGHSDGSSGHSSADMSAGMDHTGGGDHGASAATAVPR
jgi:hypothetical protein